MIARFTIANEQISSLPTCRLQSRFYSGPIMAILPRIGTSISIWLGVELETVEDIELN